MTRIILIGYMGAGKTTVGKALSQSLALPFYDLDWYIEERYRRTIPQIFAENGENGFREIEQKILHEVAEFENVIISCGGGVAMRERNVAEMKKNGKVVLLKADPQTILDRVKDSDERPLLNGHKNVEYIADLMEARRAKYEAAADIVVQTDGKSALEICEEMIHKLRSADE